MVKSMNIFTPDEQTIIAQCTPSGKGALALLRLSGINALKIATTFAKLASGKKIYELPTHTIAYGWVVDDHDNKIDQVLFFIMHAPKTFTGQNVVEISCHNNPFIIQAIIERAILCGTRLAQEGEFTKRAVLNGKLDLTQAEAINELIYAHTQTALKKSLAQLDGSFSHWIRNIELNLVQALALCEASFEFLDEEISFDHQIKKIITKIISTIIAVKKTFDQQERIRQGIRIALIGSVNAGKSSLFNALLNKERAIVTTTAGTTRDSIEAGIYRNGNYWTLVDTAGLRESDDVIEQAGIERSLNEARLADIILLICDGSRQLSEKEYAVYRDLSKKYSKKIIFILSKADLGMAREQIIQKHLKALSISSATKKGINLVEHEIEEKLQTLLDKATSPFLVNKRQFNLLTDLENKLMHIQHSLTGAIEYELLSYHLNDALSNLAELTGKTISDETLNTIFKQFCIGK